VTPNAIFVLWLCLFAVEQAWLWLLTDLNLHHVQQHAAEILPTSFGSWLAGFPFSTQSGGSL
jgi:hypothetical protein